MASIISTPALATSCEYFNKLASVSSNNRDTTVHQFVNGIHDLGIWDNFICWILKSSQNVGYGVNVYSIGGLGNYDGILTSPGAWGIGGITSTTPSTFLKISNGVGLLSSQNVTSGAAYYSTLSSNGDANYYHFWVYGNQIGETDNIQYGGSFREGTGAGLINDMRSSALSGALGDTSTSNNVLQFITNVTNTDAFNNTKTYLNGNLQTTFSVPVSTPQTLASKSMLMCQDGITYLLENDGTTFYADTATYDTSYQISKTVFPQGDTGSYSGTVAFHFVVKDIALSNEQVSAIYSLYSQTIGK